MKDRRPEKVPDSCRFGNSRRGVANLALRTAGGRRRLRTNRDTSYVCVPCAAATESNARHQEKQ